MQYSPALVLAVAAIGVTATPALNLRQSDSDSSGSSDPSASSDDTQCLPGIPVTNVTLSAPGLDFSFTACCPGILSNGGPDLDCLIGGNCGVVGGDNGALSTTGACVATVPVTATDYAAQISSAYNSAGQPSVHNSAMITGQQTGDDGSISIITATGTPVDASASPSATDSGASSTITAAPSGGNTTTTASPSSSSDAPAASKTAKGDASGLKATQRSVAALAMLALGAAFL